MSNGLLFQGFCWDLPDDSKHWQRLTDSVPELRNIGVTGIWLPPAYKGTSVHDTGYSAYDLYDIGEFYQKGTVATKYGTVSELAALIKTLHDYDIRVYADVVLNHKAGADETEKFMAVPVDPLDRTKEIGEPVEIEGWTKFTFPGRGNKYSDFKWSFEHFTAVDLDQATGDRGIFRILGENKGFGLAVDSQYGNYDYLMHSDIDLAHPGVREELFRWGEWYFKRFGYDGMRLDAIKHIDEPFMLEFIEEMRSRVDKDIYVVGEYWIADIERMRAYLDKLQFHMQLFDVALHFNFEQAGTAEEDYDLRNIFDSTLVNANPLNVVTFVDNHDSQPGQALESFVADWFKPLAYALILLRHDGYPCLFYGDYYGIGGHEGAKEILQPLLSARRDRAYGPQEDYFFDKNAIAFVRKGDMEFPHSGLVCVLSNGGENSVEIQLGEDRADQLWFDMTGNRQEELTLDEDGGANFTVNGRSVSIWAEKTG
ncbi:MAG TPA: alpha-amylase [Bacillota bacterium]|nr:alpha-amylase [Bacillota bacterium]